MSQEETLDLGQMLTESLDEFEEAPDYVLPPPGTYILSVLSAEIEKVKNKAGQQVQRLRTKYAIQETIELLTNEEPPVPNGSLISQTFNGSKEGLGYFKKAAREILGVSDLAGVSLGDILSSLTGAQFTARLSVKRTLKEGTKDDYYSNVTIKVVPTAQ